MAQVSIYQLRELEVDGIIVRNFLTKQESRTLYNRLFALPENQGLTNSKTYPGNYALIDYTKPEAREELNDYYRLCKQFTDSFEATYGVPLVDKLLHLFTLLNGGTPARIPQVMEDGHYTPLTFRMIHPEKCHINIHCGNQFLNQYPMFYESILKQADVWNQLSFFTVINHPQQGGELSVYNVAWDVAKEISVPEQAIITNDGQMLHAANPDELFRQKFDMQEGDLILFSAGQLWHRVEEVFGPEWRITAGGFLGFGTQDKSAYIWS